ncbi:hypothetical protein, partial [Bacillus pumilus]|uniref:hypothetical protein n=1 Tax=Bacillus pumilus TaxID=1408 RepID=UPI003CE8E680
MRIKHDIAFFCICELNDDDKIKTDPTRSVSDRRQTPPLLQVKVGFSHFFDKNIMCFTLDMVLSMSSLLAF